MHVSDYYVVEAESAEDLSKRVSEVLKQGDWELQGNVVIGNGKYHQALVRLKYDSNDL